MKTKFVITALLFFLIIGFLNAKKPVTIRCTNSNDSCKYETNIWLMDMNNDDKYDESFIRACTGVVISMGVSDNSSATLSSQMTAKLVNGSVDSKNFLFIIYNPEIDNYICRLYFDTNLQSAVLEDYSQNDKDPTSYEEADNYFYTQQIGSLLLITKKADIDVQSVMLCSLDGRVISHLQNVGSWSQFSFDMSLEPSGMYLLRFIARDKALTKRVIYIR